MLARLQPGLVLSDFLESGSNTPATRFAPDCGGQAGTPDRLFASHAQGVGYAIDVVKPGCDERDLQDCPVVDSGGAQAVMVVFPDFRGVLGKFDDIVQHQALLLADGGSCVVLL
jgi:hypothetical protein